MTARCGAGETTWTASSATEPSRTRAVPVQIGSDNTWRSLGGTEFSSFAIKANGTLWAWSRHSIEVVFHSSERLAPAQVGTDTDWSSVAGGRAHAIAIKTNGTLWGFGSGQRGQLGAGVEGDAYDPQQIGTANDWATVTASDDFSVATKTDGSLWAWGDNTDGQIANGATGGDQLTPRRIGTDSNWVRGGSSK